MAQEKKSNYGATESLFAIELSNVKNGGNVFVVLNKFKSPGKFQPVYKTETKPSSKGTYSFCKI